MIAVIATLALTGVTYWDSSICFIRLRCWNGRFCQFFSWWWSLCFSLHSAVLCRCLHSKRANWPTGHIYKNLDLPPTDSEKVELLIGMDIIRAHRKEEIRSRWLWWLCSFRHSNAVRGNSKRENTSKPGPRAQQEEQSASKLYSRRYPLDRNCRKILHQRIVRNWHANPKDNLKKMTLEFWKF